LTTTVATKLSESEARLLEKITEEYGFVSKSEVVRNAVRLYLSLLSLKPKERLITLRLINEVVSPSRISSSELIEEAHREEDLMPPFCA